MSYANATVDPAQRAKAAISVIAIHALLGAGLVAGLAVTGVIPVPEPRIEGTIVKLDPPPPPPDEIVPEVPQNQSYIPPQAPEAPIRIDRNTPINVAPFTDTSSDVVLVIPSPTPITGPGPAVTPSPTPSFAAVGARPSNSMQSWITSDDYSNVDLRRGREGVARYRLVVGSNGRVDACEITGSTGHASLDTATCRLIERRARFNPATNTSGDRVVGTYNGTVTWQIPE